jgi:hypothetical protein
MISEYHALFTFLSLIRDCLRDGDKCCGTVMVLYLILEGGNLLTCAFEFILQGENFILSPQDVQLQIVNGQISLNQLVLILVLNYLILLSYYLSHQIEPY